MKKTALTIVAIVAIIICLPIVAQAQTSTSFTLGMWSEYLGSNGGIFADKPVMQGSLDVSWNNGVYASLWGSLDLQSPSIHDGFGNEVDFTLGWATSHRPWSLDVGLLYIDAVGLDSSHNDFLEPYGQLGYTLQLPGKGSLTMFVRGEQYWVVADSDSNGGTFYFVGFNHEWEVGSLNVTEEVLFGHDSGAFNQNPGAYTKGFVKVSIPLNQHMVGWAMLKFANPVTVRGDGRKFESIPGAGFTYSF